MGFLKRLFRRHDPRPAPTDHYEPNEWQVLVTPEMVAAERNVRTEPECRADPTNGAIARASAVTVTCEEYYQPTIEAAMPPDSDPDRGWPLVCDLAVMPRNPHSKDTCCSIEVRVGDAPVGYLTPKMTERYRSIVQECTERGERSTALATVRRGTKSGESIWRVKVHIG
jgi:hypothetical protein